MKCQRQVERRQRTETNNFTEKEEIQNGAYLARVGLCTKKIQLEVKKIQYSLLRSNTPKLRHCRQRRLLQHVHG
jgi:hypothetical protein